MDDPVRDAVGSLFEEYELGPRLHEVPPHLVHEVTVDGRRGVCKVSTDPRGDAGVEGRVLRYVDRETAVPVPEVLTVGEGVFVAAYRADAPEIPAAGEGVADEEWLYAAGRALGRLHDESGFDRPGLLAVDGDPADPGAGLAVEADPDATWSDALRDLLGVYHEEVRGSGFGDVVVDAREFVAAHADRFDVLDDRDPALLHGWFTPEHVAVEDGEVVCALDFEHALVGSGEWDFWRAAVPLFAGPGWETPEEGRQRFREGYESVRPLPGGFEEREDAHRMLVAVSYLDSLSTQRGITPETRERADFFREQVRKTLAALRDRWD
jgi:fructosamine-3-kinase